MAALGGPSNISVRGAREVERYINSLPQETYEDARQIFRQRAALAHAQVVLNATTKLRRRTGHLARSLKFSVTGTKLENLEASVYASAFVGTAELEYTKVHEFGATIRAKRAYKGIPGGPYLNIPTQSNKTAAGVQRLSAKEVFSQGGFMRFKAGGAGWLVIHPTRGVMFILRKQVTIPARLGMRDAVEAQIPGLLQDLDRVVAED